MVIRCICISVGCAEAVHVALVFLRSFILMYGFVVCLFLEMANDGVNDAYPTVYEYIYIYNCDVVTGFNILRC